MEKKQGVLAEAWGKTKQALNGAHASIGGPPLSEREERNFRRMFYLGAEATFVGMVGGMETKTGSEEATEEDIAVIEGVHQELKEFEAALKEGKA